MSVIGRNIEKKVLSKALKTNQSELIAVVGRRRVGKTHMIKNFLKNDIIFEFTGLFHGEVPDHMDRWSKALSQSIYKDIQIKEPQNWFEAFDILESGLERIKSKKKKVIFMDEFPWMATNRSKFLMAFSNFWNTWASTRKDIVLIISGSSTSWMINKVFKNRGGLYNRVTQRIYLQPFDLNETELFLKSKGIVLNRAAITELYLIMGGIPYYLEQIEPGESVVQIVDRLFFGKGATLKVEYDELFNSLFDQGEIHESIVQELSENPVGLSRTQLLQKTKVKSGGGFTRIIDELEKSGFISAYIPYGKKTRGTKYKLTDPFTLFYMKFLFDQGRKKQSWKNVYQSPSWFAWSGLAFENLCMLHLKQITDALGIEGISSSSSSWYNKGDETMHGAQIDLLIDRADKVINLCEIKYTSEMYTITKAYDMKLRNKIASFKHFTKTRKSIFPVIITPFGLTQNAYAIGLIQRVITMDDLFEK